jgi:hypothetical protein
MSDLPEALGGGQAPSRHVARAVKVIRSTEMAVLKHSLKARYEAECERLDAQALSDVVKTALDEEMTNMDYGMRLAAGSPAKAEIVARKLAMQAQIDEDRIRRRFGR